MLIFTFLNFGFLHGVNFESYTHFKISPLSRFLPHNTQQYVSNCCRDVSFNWISQLSNQQEWSQLGEVDSATASEEENWLHKRYYVWVYVLHWIDVLFSTSLLWANNTFWFQWLLCSTECNARNSDEIQYTKLRALEFPTNPRQVCCRKKICLSTMQKIWVDENIRRTYEIGWKRCRRESLPFRRWNSNILTSQRDEI